MDTVQRVRDLLAERNLSLYKFSQMSNISYPTFRNTEKRGGQLTVDTIERVCEALDITLPEFFQT